MAIPSVNLNVDRRGYAGGLARPLSVQQGSGYRGRGGARFGAIRKLLEDGMRMRQAIEAERLKALRDQRGRDRALFTRAMRAGGQGGRPQTHNYGEAAEALLGGPRAYQAPGEKRRLAQLLRFFGPEAAHRGLMQTGALMGGQGRRGAFIAPPEEELPNYYGAARGDLGAGPEPTIEDLRRVRGRRLPARRGRGGSFTNRDLASVSKTAGGYKEGTVPGRVPKTEEVKIHKGEIVVPKKQADDPRVQQFLRDDQRRKIMMGIMNPPTFMEEGYQSGSVNPYLFDAIRRAGGIRFGTRYAPPHIREMFGRNLSRIRNERSGMSWEQMARRLEEEEGFRLGFSEGLAEDDFWDRVSESYEAKRGKRPEPSMNIMHSEAESFGLPAEEANHYQEQARIRAEEELERMRGAGPVDPVRGPQDVLPADPEFQLRERARRRLLPGAPAAVRDLVPSGEQVLPLPGEVPESRGLVPRRENLPTIRQTDLAPRTEVLPPAHGGELAPMGPGALEETPPGPRRGRVRDLGYGAPTPGAARPMGSGIRELTALGDSELDNVLKSRSGVGGKALKGLSRNSKIALAVGVPLAAVTAYMASRGEEGESKTSPSPSSELVSDSFLGIEGLVPKEPLKSLSTKWEGVPGTGTARGDESFPEMLGKVAGGAAGTLLGVGGEILGDIGKGFSGAFGDPAVQADVLEEPAPTMPSLPELPPDILDQYVEQAETDLDLARQNAQGVQGETFRESESAKQKIIQHRDRAQKLYDFISDNGDSMSDREYESYLRRADRQDKLADKLEKRIEQVQAKSERDMDRATKALEGAREVRVGGKLGQEEQSQRAYQQATQQLEESYDKLMMQFVEGKVENEDVAKRMLAQIIFEGNQLAGRAITMDQAFETVEQELGN